MPAVVFRKSILSRAVHYLFLLPFLPVLRPLLVQFNPVDLLVYCFGFLFTAAFIAYGNYRPLIRAEDSLFYLYWPDPNSPQSIPYESLKEYQDLGAGRLVLHHAEKEHYTLRMNKKDARSFMELLKNKGVQGEQALKTD